MAKRHRDALAIQHGACNPSGIALSIAEACSEIRAEPGHTGTNQLTLDPAVRLMVHQLAYLTRNDQIEGSLTLYSDLTAACEAAR